MPFRYTAPNFSRAANVLAPMPPFPITARTPYLSITVAWYGSSRLLVVGPAAFTFHAPFSCNITGPQWYSTAPRKATGASCFLRHPCTLPRPVYTPPHITTTPPTLNPPHFPTSLLTL